jgi:HPt (histidine-containing phosphotransfer) domain-containing protein
MNSKESNSTEDREKRKEIDLTVMDGLLALRKPGAPDPRRRIITIYIDTATKLMEAIRTGFAEADYTSLKKAAHSLKSSSMNVGAIALSDICIDLERSVMSDSLDDAGELIKNAETKFAAVMDALKEALNHT